MEYLRVTLRLVGERLRSQILRIRGASLDSKVRIGRNVKVDNPQCLKIGARAFLEGGIYLKIVSKNAQLQIGHHTFLGTRVEVDVSDRVIIGSHTLIAPGCFITDHNHGMEPSRKIDDQNCVAARVVIGSDVWIGANCIVLPGVTIGDGAVIGAAAVVNSDVGEMDIFAGVPARKIGSRLKQ